MLRCTAKRCLEARTPVLSSFEARLRRAPQDDGMDRVVITARSNGPFHTARLLTAWCQQRCSRMAADKGDPMTPFDAFPPPPCAVLLGWTLLDHDAALGTIRVAFEGRAEFLNPAGFVQGGMLAAMLGRHDGGGGVRDDRGPPVHGDGRDECELSGARESRKADRRGPHRPARQEHRLLEASLCGEDGRVLARATAHARLVDTARLAAA